MTFTSQPPTSQITSASGKKWSAAWARFHDGEIGAENIDEEVLAVSGQGQRGDPIVTGAADLPHELLGVLDRIALRQGIAAKQHLAVMVEHHGLRGGAAEIAA